MTHIYKAPQDLSGVNCASSPVIFLHLDLLLHPTPFWVCFCVCERPIYTTLYIIVSGASRKEEARHSLETKDKNPYLSSPSSLIILISVLACLTRLILNAGLPLDDIVPSFLRYSTGKARLSISPVSSAGTCLSGRPKSSGVLTTGWGPGKE